jgi:hypothetical protein
MKLAQTEITLPAVTTGVNIKPKEQNIQKILEDAAASMSSSTPPSEETDPPEAQEPIQEPMVCLFSFSRFFSDRPRLPPTDRESDLTSNL